MRTVAVLIRLDTEDFLTAASDDAALRLARLLDEQHVRATFPLTTWKVEAILRRRRLDVLHGLARHDLGFHSTSHSVHPTIAEELEGVPDEAAVAAFRKREEEGFRRVEAVLDRPLVAYTQPGANWVAEATPALRDWGVPLYHSEGWNGYIDVAGRPFFLGGVLHFARTVAAPKPFFNRLPARLAEALAIFDEAYRAALVEEVGEIGFVHVVAHPTECVTEAFWDVVNFAGGQNRPKGTWQAPPLRTPESVEATFAAFRHWLEEAKRRPGVEFWGAADLVAAFPDPVPRTLWRPEAALRLAQIWQDGRVGSVSLDGVIVSAAEALGILAEGFLAIYQGMERRTFRVLPPDPPFGETSQGARATLAQLVELASSLQGGRSLPPFPAGLPIRAAPTLLARAVVRRLASGHWPEEVEGDPVTLLPERFVKPEEALHWDWPIFPPEFRARNILRRARTATWTLRPVDPAFVDFVL